MRIKPCPSGQGNNSGINALGVEDGQEFFEVVEHPRLVAQRIERYAQLVGRENVLAGTDCGFGTFVGLSTVDPDIAWAKFRAMAEGARLASEHLWARQLTTA